MTHEDNGGSSSEERLRLETLPTMLTTRMLSLQPGTVAFRQHIPRTFN